MIYNFVGDCNRPLGLLVERKIIIIIIIIIVVVVVVAVTFEPQHSLLTALNCLTMQMAQYCVTVESYST